ncbi:hypothetical protein [Flavobacterium lacisediminis]|uniref:DUF4412 domain-containing protein n=1 Tax=Flavobacterium lacisediminis TaxID=2989705 RepID=A0ABT3EGE7_9FLAO|nr:hypothetical protein [Flavobacterium lacisediminis]MCW1147519.1 hypothetical protein [Flavobacterium lacisediminis]
MKKITQIALTALLFVGITANAQTQLKKGSVTYNMTMPGASEEMAAMGESTITVHFNESMQATDMSMMGGMMLMKTIVPTENKKDSKMTMEVMGMKYEITDVGEEASKTSKGLSNLDDAKEIVYDKKDTKEIVGFKCYKATVTMNDDTKSTFYVTEAIAPQAPTSADAKVKLTGYPLEIKVQTAQGEMIMTATKFSKEIPADAFKVGEGFTKVTMEEFQKQMGGM